MLPHCRKKIKIKIIDAFAYFRYQGRFGIQSLPPSLPMIRLLSLSVSVSTAPNRNAIQAVDFYSPFPFLFKEFVDSYSRLAKH
jgi:hypothetical protein